MHFGDVGGGVITIEDGAAGDDEVWLDGCDVADVVLLHRAVDGDD